MKYHLLPVMFLLLLAAGCGQGSPGNTEQPSTSPPPSAQESNASQTTGQPSAAPEAAATLPSVPLALLQDIARRGSQIDYIFYNYPFTMSISELSSIQGALRYISEAPAPLNPACKPTGRVSYQIAGNIVLEGDFYFSPGCTYFVFEENRQKKYSNLMTPEGITYFNNQIEQALKIHQNAQQQAK